MPSPGSVHVPAALGGPKKAKRVKVDGNIPIDKMLPKKPTKKK